MVYYGSIDSEFRTQYMYILMSGPCNLMPRGKLFSKNLANIVGRIPKKSFKIRKTREETKKVKCKSIKSYDH